MFFTFRKYLYLYSHVEKNVVADIWGFDKNAVDVLQNMKPLDEDLNQKYAILLENSGFIPETETEVREGCNSYCKFIEYYSKRFFNVN